MLVGHLAVSALEHRYAKVDFAPVMAAAIVPDLIDKVAHYGMGSTTSGRLWGHTLLVALVSTGIVCLLFGRRSGLSWGLGYLSHLMCDIGGVVPWLYPLISYEFPPAETFGTTLYMSLTRPRIILEVALLIWAYLVFRSQLHKGMQQIHNIAREKWRSWQKSLLNP